MIATLGQQGTMLTNEKESFVVFETNNGGGVLQKTLSRKRAQQCRRQAFGIRERGSYKRFWGTKKAVEGDISKLTNRVGILRLQLLPKQKFRIPNIYFYRLPPYSCKTSRWKNPHRNDDPLLVRLPFVVLGIGNLVCLSSCYLKKETMVKVSND